MPGGKIALAAMPSALLLSIGLTPQLAQAQPGDQNPFREGPCVSAPDQEPEEDGEDGKDADKEKSDGDKAEGGGKGKGGSPDDGKPGEGSKDPGAKPTPEPTPDKPNTPDEPEPEPSESRHPLDPLGIGEKLRELFNPDKDKGSDEDSDEGNAEDNASDPDPSGEPSEGGEKSGDSAKEKAAKEKAAKEKAAKEKAEEEAAKEAESEPDADGKKPFPCPEFDKEAYDGADSEQTPVQVPDEPFKLNTTRLGLDGLKYHGIVKVRTHGGTEKRVLKFTAKKVDIKDLHQIVVGPGGKSQHIRSTEGSTSTFRDGTVTMYTEELKGKLFGLIPVTFGPESPPPLDIPTAVFTDAEVIQAGQFGGTLTVPGLKMSLED